VLAAGCSVLLQGEFSSAQERQAAAAVAQAAQVPFLGLWLDAPPADLEPGLWHCLPPGAGAAAAVETAELLLTSINAPPGETWQGRKNDVP
jgi:predicted kinase